MFFTPMVSAAGGAGGTSGLGGTSTDNALVRWDGVNGDSIQDSGIIIDDSDNLTTPGTISVPAGSSSDPAFAFSSSTLGIYRSGSATIRFAINSDYMWQFSNANMSHKLANSLTVPRVTDANDPNTGIGWFAADTVGIITAGSPAVRWNNLSQTLASNGFAFAPSLSFASDSASGLFLSSASNIGIVTAGTARLNISASQVKVTADGTEALPSLVVAREDVNSGLWGPAADTVAISTGGVEAMRWNASQQTLIPDGSGGVPSLALASNTGNGIFGTTQDLQFSVGGVSQVIISTTIMKVNNSLMIEEKAAATTDNAGYGQIWVKNDAPNTLWFTDDAGTDFQLGAGGASTLQAAYDGGSTITPADDTSPFIIKKDGLAEAYSQGILLENKTDAASGVQQHSPGIEFVGQGFKSSFITGSEELRMTMQLRAVEASAEPTGLFVIAASTDGSALADKFTFDTTLGQFCTKDGTAAAPSHSFIGRESYGMYYVTGSIGWALGGVVELKLGSSALISRSNLTLDLGTPTNRFTEVYTSVLDIQKDSVGENETVAVFLDNSTAATVSTHQYSPAIRFEGRGWSLADNASSVIKWIQQAEASQVAGSEPLTSLVFKASVDNAAFSTMAAINSSGQILSGNGVVGAPGWSFVSDPNSGLFLTSGDNIGFVTGGVERMRMTTTTFNFGSTPRPVSDGGTDLGLTGTRWGTLFVDDATVTTNITAGGDIDAAGGMRRTLHRVQTLHDSPPQTKTMTSDGSATDVLGWMVPARAGSVVELAIWTGSDVTAGQADFWVEISTDGGDTFADLWGSSGSPIMSLDSASNPEVNAAAVAKDTNTFNAGNVLRIRSASNASLSSLTLYAALSIEC